MTFRSGLFAAGPESAGAHPGPVNFEFSRQKEIIIFSPKITTFHYSFLLGLLP